MGGRTVRLRLRCRRSLFNYLMIEKRRWPRVYHRNNMRESSLSMTWFLSDSGSHGKWRMVAVSTNCQPMTLMPKSRLLGMAVVNRLCLRVHDTRRFRHEHRCFRIASTSRSLGTFDGSCDESITAVMCDRQHLCGIRRGHPPSEISAQPRGYYGSAHRHSEY